MAATDVGLTVGLVQINNSFSGQNYFPYSTGLLQAYAIEHAPNAGRYQFLLPIYKRVGVREAVEHLLSADVVGFSTYVWNIRISLEIARRIKAKNPETLIVFGGPQVPDRSEAFLREHTFIDVACHGEGEAVFLDVLENFPARTWSGIESVSYLEPDGTYVQTPRRARTKDMSRIPSPYLEGLFDGLIEANPEERWLLLWETNRGCPFSCTFCDWGSAVAAKVYQFDMERLHREIDWMAENQVEFAFCCDANFGILARDLDITEYVVKVKQQTGFPQALSVQNTKNATERAYTVQKLLADAGLNKGVTISMQSLDPATLTAVKRQNISSESFQELQRRFTRDRVETYSDMILGMPEETYDSFIDGITMVMDDGQHNRIQFNNLSILPNAEMGDPEYQKKYGMELIESKIINMHGSLTEHEIQEYQDLVVATASMPRPEWRRTRAFCWMTSLIYFDKILQIPIVLAHELCDVGYRELLESFMEADATEFPTLAFVREFFLDKARDIQEGGEEYCHSERWLNIYWPADELVLIHLCTENRLDAFYRDAEELLARRAPEGSDVQTAIREAVRLNQALMKLPFQTTDLDFHATYDVWEYYRGILEGNSISFEKSSHNYHIDRTSTVFDSWEEWCQQVIWYGNKKGAYLYSSEAVEPQLEGHY